MLRRAFHVAFGPSSLFALKLCGGLALVVCGSTRTAQACDELYPWSRLPRSGRELLTPVPAVMAGAAIAAPLIIAPLGWDHDARVFSQRSLGGSYHPEPVSVAAPFILPVLLLATDAIALPLQACEVARPTSAMLQAMALSLGSVVVLKWVTGRSFPNAGRDPNAADRLEHPENARQFHWFSYRQGTAWPSGHTALMFAAAAALSNSLPQRAWLGYLGYVAATGVAFGMWFGDHHWASDILSGALLGYGMGRSVGRAFAEPARPEPVLSWQVVPWATPAAAGLSWTGSW